MNRSFSIFPALVLTFGATGSANAQDTPQPPTRQSAKPQLDPGEVICQRIVVAGSRIIAKRYCMTRMQWQEQQTGDREFTEKVQLPLQLRDGG